MARGASRAWPVSRARKATVARAATMARQAPTARPLPRQPPCPRPVAAPAPAPSTRSSRPYIDTYKDSLTPAQVNEYCAPGGILYGD